MPVPHPLLSRMFRVGRAGVMGPAHGCTLSTPPPCMQTPLLPLNEPSHGPTLFNKAPTPCEVSVASLPTTPIALARMSGAAADATPGPTSWTAGPFSPEQTEVRGPPRVARPPSPKPPLKAAAGLCRIHDPCGTSRSSFAHTSCYAQPGIHLGTGCRGCRDRTGNRRRGRI